jgi:hypothetical protein
MSQQTSDRIEPTGSRRVRSAACALGLSLVLILTAWVAGASAAPSGSALWVATYNGPRSDEDVPAGMATSPDGGTVFVTGRSGARGAGSDNFATIAYDAATGGEMWTSIYNPPVHLDDTARGIAASPTENVVFVTGVSLLSLSAADDIATIAYDGATGDELWTRRYDGSFQGEDFVTAIAVSPDGSRVFVTGSTELGFGRDAMLTIAYDAATGHKLWVRKLEDPAGLLGSGQHIAVTPDGGAVFVSEELGSHNTLRTATVGYDAATGDKLWVRQYDGLLFASPVALAASPDSSSLYLLARTSSHTQNFTFATLSYDTANGDVRWQSRFHSEGDDDIPTSLAVAPDGSTVFSAGSSFRSSTGGIDYTTIAYDTATGGRNWVRHYDGPGDGYDAITSIAMSPSGARVYVTGDSTGATSGEDYGTIAYDAAAGDRVWVHRFDGAGDSEDRAVSIVPDPDGSKVFVTGGSVGPSGNGRDYATVAYSS